MLDMYAAQLQQNYGDHERELPPMEDISLTVSQWIMPEPGNAPPGVIGLFRNHQPDWGDAQQIAIHLSNTIILETGHAIAEQLHQGVNSSEDQEQKASNRQHDLRYAGALLDGAFALEILLGPQGDLAQDAIQSSARVDQANLSHARLAVNDIGVIGDEGLLYQALFSAHYRGHTTYGAAIQDASEPPDRDVQRSMLKLDANFPQCITIQCVINRQWLRLLHAIQALRATEKPEPELQQRVNDEARTMAALEAVSGGLEA